MLSYSEHGDLDGAHKLEHKGILYEEAARVPFTLTWGGHLPAGRVDETHLISFGLDVLPTLCDYAGIQPPQNLPGRSLRPLVEGQDGVNWRNQLVVESRHGRMLRTGRYKYVVYGSDANREQLFDLKNDPGEMDNLAADPHHRRVLEEQRRRLAHWPKRCKLPQELQRRRAGERAVSG